MVVPSFTATEIREIFEMRAVLESLLARLSAVMRSVRDLDVYMSHHEAFHDLVARRAELPRAQREFASKKSW